MAKILTDKEMGQIVHDATHRDDVIEGSDSYRHFLEDLGELIASNFGSERGSVSCPDGDGLGWTCGFRINECVPSDGGVFQEYDRDVRWIDGKEDQDDIKDHVQKNDVIEIMSSSGVIVVDANSGPVVDGLGFHGELPARFDVAELKVRFSDTYAGKFTSFDILNVGSWDKSGVYSPPCEEWQRDTKENIVTDLSAQLEVEISHEEIPDAVFWQSTPEELRQWVCENLSRLFSVSITEGFGICVPVGEIRALRQRESELEASDLASFNAKCCHREVLLILLTNDGVKKVANRFGALWNAYISRWVVEEAIRFMKQSYNLEDIRLLDRQRLKNTVGVLLVALYFLSVHLGQGLRLEIFAGHIVSASKRFYGISEFCYYALADGLGALLSRIRPKRPSLL